MGIDSNKELNDKLDMFGLSVEEVNNTKTKISEYSQEKPKIHTEKGFTFKGLSDIDRQQAVKEFIIPESYVDAYFSIEKIKSNIKDQYKKTGKTYLTFNFSTYERVCNDILCSIRLRQLPKRSYLIGAPNGFGKTSFVNECLITLRKFGFSVVPYISLWELAQIRVDNEQRIMQPYKKFQEKDEKIMYLEPNLSKGYQKLPEVVTGRFSYSEYINADCLFVSLTDVISKDIESHTLYQLLSIRSIKGLPTIVTMSTSLLPYENDKQLKEIVWDEIKTYNETKHCYDRVYHVSCYKKKNLALNCKNLKIEKNTGIVLGEQEEC